MVHVDGSGATKTQRGGIIKLWETLGLQISNLQCYFKIPLHTPGDSGTHLFVTGSDGVVHKLALESKSTGILLQISSKVETQKENILFGET